MFPPCHHDSVAMATMSKEISMSNGLTLLNLNVTLTYYMYRICRVYSWFGIGRFHVILQCYFTGIVPFHNNLFISGEQPEQRKLSHTLKQQTDDCRAIFHKYFCHTKHGGIVTNLTLWNLWGHITDILKIQQCGYMEHGLKYFVLYVQKHIAHRVVWYNFPLVRDTPLRAPAVVRVIYWGNCTIALVSI